MIAFVINGTIQPLVFEELVESDVIDVFVDFLPYAAKRFFFEREVGVCIAEFRNSFDPFLSMFWCIGFVDLKISQSLSTSWEAL